MDAIFRKIICSLVLFFIPLFATAFENEETFLKNSYVVTNQTPAQYEKKQQTERIQNKSRMEAQHLRRKREREMRHRRYELYKNRMHKHREMERMRRKQVHQNLKNIQGENQGETQSHHHKMHRALSAKEQRYRQWTQENQDLRSKMAQHDEG